MTENLMASEEAIVILLTRGCRASEELAHELDSITVDAYLKQHIRFKSVQDVIEIHLRLLTGADLNQITVLWLLSYAKWQGCKSFYDFLHNVPIS